MRDLRIGEDALHRYRGGGEFFAAREDASADGQRTVKWAEPVRDSFHEHYPLRVWELEADDLERADRLEGEGVGADGMLAVCGVELLDEPDMGELADLVVHDQLAEQDGCLLYQPVRPGQRVGELPCSFGQ